MGEREQRSPPDRRRKLAHHFNISVDELREFPDVAPGGPPPDFFDKLADLVAAKVLKELQS